MVDRRTALLGAVLVLTCTAAVAGNESVDASSRPGDDFYGYANNAWLAATRLPEGASRTDTSAQLRTENARRVRGLIDDALAATGVGKPVRPEVRKLADYYRARLDTATIEARGLTVLASDLATIAAIGDRHALAVWLGRTVSLDDGGNQRTESLFGVWIHQGFHDPYRYAAHVVQGGLGLADRDTYLDPGMVADSARTAYRARIADVLKHAGFDRAEERAGRVLDLEIAIARTHASRADTDDVFKTDNEWRRVDFAVRAPGIDWDAYFTAAGLNTAPSFVVWQPGAVIGGATLVASQPLDAWKDYLAFHLIDHYADVLPRAGDGGDAGDALVATEAVFGDAIGRLYVERYFPPRARVVAEAMVANIRAAFRTRIAGSTWMSPATKSKALAKLAALKIGLGHPLGWTDYSPLAVTRGDAFGNLRRAEGFAYRRELAKLARPVDPGEWPSQLHPQQVAAILDVSPNAMKFAAGLLQPPYFDPDGDAASNYGSAGAGIAHEISHSFDELGNLYDAQGRLGLWWSKGDQVRFRATSAPLAGQLNGCAAAPGVYARGAQVLAESVADLGGLTVAYDAYHLSLRGRIDTIRNGLTGDQRFFIAFAQRWRRLQTDAALRAQIATDNHAPPTCRSGLVRNLDVWIRAFDVRPGDKMYVAPKARSRIW